ncbi:MAG: GH3 auxin-responsive promoter family protein, partial [Bacteroidota bacterium]
MSVFNQLVSWWFKKRMHQMELFMRYPHDVQNEVLEKLLSKAKNTAWGEDFGYEDLNGPHD